MRIFLAIARNGSLGGAARQLGQTQPTMGRRLSALEDEVGHKLFQRTAHGFMLSDEGASVFNHAERAEEEMLRFERVLAGADDQVSGLLRVSSSDWFGTYMLTPILVELGMLHPQVVTELLTDTRLYNLSRREADIAFRIVPFTEQDVVSKRLLTMPYGLYAKKGSAPRIAADGEGARVVTMHLAFEDLPDARWLRETLPRATIAFRSNNRLSQAQLCAQGGCLAVLPKPLATALGTLEEVPMPVAPPSRDTYVGYHRDLRSVARLRALLDLVFARLHN
ncbi:LysR family transcriptional regulator [Janthinobacterium agaricidamnosum]|uniref:LysR family transcriptional regulator n=1 Tax=Janthinobacterium agaricidamnosum TaxID=55508 RepID=UPI0030DCAFE1